MAGDYVSQQTHSIHKRGSFPFNIRLHSQHLNKLSRESNNLNLLHIQAKDLQQSLFCSISRSFVHKPPVLSNEMLILASCAGVWRGEGFSYSVASTLYTGHVWWDQVKGLHNLHMREARLKITSIEYHHKLCEDQFWFIFHVVTDF